MPDEAIKIDSSFTHQTCGRFQPGYLADLLLVDGDPLADITVLQDHEKLSYIMKDGRFHKEANDAPGPHQPVTSSTRGHSGRRPVEPDAGR